MYPDIDLSTLLVFVKNPTTSFFPSQLSSVPLITSLVLIISFPLFIPLFLVKIFCQNDTFTLSHTSNLYRTFIITLVLIVQLRIQSVTY